MPNEAEIRQLLESQGNVFISLRSEKEGKYLRWYVSFECANGHQKDKTVGEVKKNYRCAQCLKPTIEDCIALAAAFNGKCLSTIYVNCDSYLVWLCQHGHTFESTYSNVQQGCWCKQCHLDKMCYTMDEIKKIVADKGGVCLSETYHHTQKLHLRCKEGHEFYMFLFNITGLDHWCSECSDNISERTCRKIFEFLYKLSFPKTRPAWLKSENNTLLELDGFNNDIKVGFEYDGKQHAVQIEHFGNNLVAIQSRDAQKNAKCLEFGVTLYRIPYTVPYLQLYSHIRSILPANITQGSAETINYYTDLDLRGAKSQVLEEIKEFLIENHPNITLLSTIYLNSTTALELQCSYGHKIELSWELIKKRINVCLTCSTLNTKRKYVEEVIHKYCLDQGIKLIDTYSNGQTKLNWCCEYCEKQFKNSWDNLQKSVTACPDCRHRNKPRKT